MKIGMLSQWYDPEPGPASLPGVYAREFVRQGHEVRVLTGFPNYPDGSLFPGYKIRRRATEVRDGVDITRVALYPNHSASGLGRVANYASFASSATASGHHALKDVDAVWVYNSPVTVALPLLTHTRMGQTPFFLHVQDLWPDSLIDSGMFPGGWVGRRAASIVRRIVRLTERKSAIIGVSSRSVRQITLDRHPNLDPEKIIYAPNPTDEQLFRPVWDVRRELGINVDARETVEIMYAGAVGEVQGLDMLLDVANLLRDRRDIRITLVGDGISRKRLQQRAQALGLDNVRFLGRVPMEEVPGLIAKADVQLVSLAPLPFLSYTTPSKIASLMASGVPILGQLAGDGARLIEEAGSGIVVEPGNVIALAEAMVQFADGGSQLRGRMGASGRAYYEANLSAHAVGATIIRSLGGESKLEEAKEEIP